MTTRDEVAAAIAFFEGTDDIALLHEQLGEIAPRVKRVVSRLLARGPEEAIPPPADLRAARSAAGPAAALATLRGTDDFALLQALARAVGRRIEAVEIAASAEFPEGAHVGVPARPQYPRGGAILQGTVEETGTSLRVRLDNGDTWQGPPSLARRAG